MYHNITLLGIYFLVSVALCLQAQAQNRFNSHIVYSTYTPLSLEAVENVQDVILAETSNIPLATTQSVQEVSKNQDNFENTSNRGADGEPFLLAETSSKISKKWQVALSGEGKRSPTYDPSSSDARAAGLVHIKLQYRY